MRVADDLHQADSAPLDPVVNVQQVVVLDLSDVGGDLGDALHGRLVRAIVLAAIRRKDFDRDRQREAVGAAAFRQIDDALPTRPQHSVQMMMGRPAKTLGFQYGPVSL